MKRAVHFFTTDSKPRTGGVAEFVHQLAQNLVKDFDVRIFSTVPGSAAIQANYEVHKIESRPGRRLGSKKGDGFFLTRRVNTFLYYGLLARLSGDEIAHSKAQNAVAVVPYWTIESHFWCAACRQFGVPYVLMGQGKEFTENLRGPAKGWMREDFLKARKIAVNSSATGNLMREFLSRDLVFEVIHPPVDTEIYRPPDAGVLARRRSELGITNGAPVMLTVARLVRRKGIDLVLQAMASLRADFPDLRYVIAGDGPEEENVLRQIKELGLVGRVTLVAGVSDADKWVLYALCDLFVMPNRLLDGSDWEGFGIVFLEAALAGKACIGGNNGGVPDAVVQGLTGLLVDTDAPGETAGAIRALLRDETQRVNMGNAGRQRVLNEFNARRLAERFAKKCLD